MRVWAEREEKGLCCHVHRQVVDPIVVEQNAVLWVDVHVHPGAVLNAGDGGSG